MLFRWLVSTRAKDDISQQSLSQYVENIVNIAHVERCRSMVYDGDIRLSTGLWSAANRRAWPGTFFPTSITSEIAVELLSNSFLYTCPNTNPSHSFNYKIFLRSQLMGCELQGVRGFILDGRYLWNSRMYKSVCSKYQEVPNLSGSRTN